MYKKTKAAKVITSFNVPVNSFLNFLRKKDYRIDMVLTNKMCSGYRSGHYTSVIWCPLLTSYIGQWTKITVEFSIPFAKNITKKKKNI